MRPRIRPPGADVGWAQRAHRIVRKAMEYGLIPSLKCGRVKCTDCALPAVEYDHSDYSKPMEVEPVCRSCNIKRGVAIYPEGEMPRREYTTVERGKENVRLTRIKHMRMIHEGLTTGVSVKTLSDKTGYSTQYIYQIRAGMVKAGELSK